MLYPYELQALRNHSSNLEVTEGSDACRSDSQVQRNPILVGAEGFEPPTPCSQSRCATRLRYAPKKWLTMRVAARVGDNTQDPYSGQLYDPTLELALRHP